MDDRTRLAGLAVVELAVKQIDDPDRTQDHRDELAVIMKGVDAQFVALEIATVMAGIAVGHKASRCCDIALGSIIEETRKRIIDG